MVVMAVPGWGGNSSNSGVIMVSMRPWQERDMTTAEAAGRVTGAWQTIPGVRAFASCAPACPGAVVASCAVRARRAGLRHLGTVARCHSRTRARVPRSPALGQRSQETQPQAIRADRQESGCCARRVGAEYRSHAVDDDERTAHHDVRQGWRGIRCHPARASDQRASAQDLTNIYVRSEQTGELVPLANLIRVEERAGPGSLNRYNRAALGHVVRESRPGCSAWRCLGLPGARGARVVPGPGADRLSGRIPGIP